MGTLRCVATLFFATTLVFAAACGDSSDDSSGSPTGPSSTNNPPPSGVPLITGTWTGTSDFEQTGNRHMITTLSITVTEQRDRNVTGTIQYTGSGWESWRGTFTGTLSGTVDPEFLGTVNLESEPTTGSGRCRGQMMMNGRTTTRTMRWDSPTLSMTPNPPSEAPACVGTVRNIAWIVSKN